MIELRGLTKSFGDVKAVNDLSFMVERGDAFGFIGPNGAGKTTTLRLLATLLPPDQGTALLAEHDIRDDLPGARASFGYMPDFFGLYDDLRVWEYLDFFGAAYGLRPARRAQAAVEALDRVRLADKREEYVDHLSRGMKQRLCLARALLHDPPILLLDEPASGLDPLARMEMRELLQELTRLDKTILISSHILPELTGLCNRLGIIVGGRLARAGTVEELAALGPVERQVTVALADRAAEAESFLSARPNVAGVTREGNQIEVTLPGGAEEQAELLRALMGSGFSVISFSEQSTDVEDLYLQVMRGGEK